MRTFISLLLVALLMYGCGGGPTPTPTVAPTPEPSPTPSATLTQEPPPTPAAILPPVLTWDGSADLSAWQGGSDYQLEPRGDILFVQANKITPQGYLEATFPPLDLRRAPYASLVARADISANLAVGLVDGSGAEGWIPGNYANREMAHGEHPLTHAFDFSGLRIDLSRVTGMRIACNRGGPLCRASFEISEIRLGGGAARALAYAPLPDVTVTLGDMPLPVTPFPLSRDDEAARWQAEIPPGLVAAGEWNGGQFVYTLTGQPGRGTVTLIGEKDGRSIRLPFELTVAENQPPFLPPVAAQVLAAGESVDLRLTGLDDGDPSSSQALSLAAESDDPSVVVVTGIEHSPRSRWARLALSPKAVGETRVTLTLTDERGANVRESFAVAVAAQVFPPPAFELPAVLRLEPGGELRQEIVFQLEPARPVRLAAESDTPGLAAVIEGGALVLRADAEMRGAAQVTVTATAGAAAGHGLPVEYTRVVRVTVQPTALTALSDLFDGPEVDAALAGSGEGAHNLAIDDGALRVEIDKYATNNQWAGLWYTLPGELDLTENPVITLRVKADRETAMLIFLWDADDRYNTAGTATAIVGPEWREVVFDFTGKDLDAEGRAVDFSRVKALLFNFAPGQMHRGTVWLDDLRVGAAAGALAAPPALAIQAPPRFTLLPGSAVVEPVTVNGLPPGGALEMVDMQPGLLAEARLSPQEDGRFLLSLKAAPDAAGITRLRLTSASEDGRTAEKFIDVIVTEPGEPILLAVDRETRHQEIAGFGAFLGSQVWDRQKQDLALPFVQDLNITIARFGIIDTDFEPRNDNANPYVTDFSAFDLNALPLEWMRRLKAESAVDKFILTVWSPPAWMKKGRTLGALPGSGENFVEERYYQEYAEYLAAIVQVIKEQADIDLYAISVQNEPQFNQPYPSALLSAEKMAQVLQAVVERFAAEGIETRLFMPEALPQQKGIQEYIRQLDLLPAASQGTEIIAIHNYDGDGINVGGAGAQEWAALYQWANQARPRQVWMTETSGHPETWSGAVLLFGNIYNALVYGNASAWVWWTLAETSGSAEYGLVVDNLPTGRYAVSRHFYRAVQPGAVRVSVEGPEDVLSAAFENPDGTLAVVLYNKGKARLIAVPGEGGLLESWVTTEGQFSRPALLAGESALLPADAVMTLLFRP